MQDAVLYRDGKGITWDPCKGIFKEEFVVRNRHPYPVGRFSIFICGPENFMGHQDSNLES